MRSQAALFIEAHTAANYHGSPTEFSKEKSLINVFQASVIRPVTVDKGDGAEKICKIDDLFVQYPFEKLKAELRAKGFIFPEPRK